MTKYLINRILRSLISVIIVVAIVMILIYSCLDKTAIFKSDPVFSKQKSNGKEIYMLQQWEKYGYIDYINYTEFLRDLMLAGEIDQETFDKAKDIGKDVVGNNDIAAEYLAKFQEKYEAEGYDYTPLEGDTKGRTKKYKDGGQPYAYVTRDVPLLTRVWRYFTGLIEIDNIHKVEEDVGERGLTFTWYDPAYGGEKFSPAIIGNGTNHKYLLYTNDKFPYIHQNLIDLDLGASYSINRGIDVWDTMTQTQGAFEMSTVTYPTGTVEESADNLHSATLAALCLPTTMWTIIPMFLSTRTACPEWATPSSSVFSPPFWHTW